jgi:hypothetical protein
LREVLLTPADTKSVERFVRGTLGCRCPDEIFADIAITHERHPDSNLTYTRLVLGNRLLVYVLDAQHPNALRADVATMTTKGRADRDTEFLNRFRLVVTADRPVETQAEVDAAFSGAAGHDDHAHLHVIDADKLPTPLGTS